MLQEVLRVQAEYIFLVKPQVLLAYVPQLLTDDNRGNDEHDRAGKLHHHQRLAEGGIPAQPRYRPLQSHGRIERRQGKRKV